MFVELFAWVCGEELPLLTQYATRYNRSLSRAFRVKACMIFIAAAWSRVFLWILEHLTDGMSLPGTVIVAIVQGLVVHALVGLLAYGTHHPHTVDHMLHEFTSFRWKDTYVLLLSRYHDDLTRVNTLLAFLSFVLVSSVIMYTGPRLLKLFFATSETHWKAQSFNASALSVPLGFAFNNMMYVMFFGMGPRMLSAEASDDPSHITSNSRVVLLVFSVAYVVGLSYLVSFVAVETEARESVQRSRDGARHRLSQKQDPISAPEQQSLQPQPASEHQPATDSEGSFHTMSQLTEQSNLAAGASDMVASNLTDTVASNLTDIESNIRERDDDEVSIPESVMTDAVAEMDRFDAAEFYVETTTAVDDLADGNGLETNLLDEEDEIPTDSPSTIHEHSRQPSVARGRQSSVARGRSSYATPRQRVSRAVKWGLKMLLQLFAASAVGWAWVAAFLIWAAEDKSRKKEFEDPESSWGQIYALLLTAFLASLFGNANIWRLHISASNHVEYYSVSTRRRIRMLLTSYALVVGVCWEEFFVTLLDLLGSYDSADGVLIKSAFATASTALFLYVQFVIDEHSNQTTRGEASTISRIVYKVYEWWFVSSQKKLARLRHVQGEYEFAVEQRIFELEQHGVTEPRRYVGWWSDGIWSIRRNIFPSAIMSLLFPWIVAAQVAEKVKSVGSVAIPACRFVGVLGICGGTFLIVVVLWATVLPWWTMWLAYISVGLMVCCLRLRVRSVFMIPGTWWADLGVSLALWCCVLSQMARHVFRYSRVCDTTQPLCVGHEFEKVETAQPRRQSTGSAT